jgi:hypothetical protein
VDVKPLLFFGVFVVTIVPRGRFMMWTVTSESNLLSSLTSEQGCKIIEL